MASSWQEKYWRQRKRASVNHKKRIERNIMIIKSAIRHYDVTYAGNGSLYAINAIELSRYTIDRMRSYGYELVEIKKDDVRKYRKFFVFEKNERRNKCKDKDDVMFRIKDNISSNNYNRKFDNVYYRMGEGLIVSDNGIKYKVTVRKTY